MLFWIIVILLPVILGSMLINCFGLRFAHAKSFWKTMPASIGIVVAGGAVAVGGSYLASVILPFGDSLDITIFFLLLVVCTAYGMRYGFHGPDDHRISTVKSFVLAVIYAAVQLVAIYFAIILAMIVIFTDDPPDFNIF